MRSKVVLRTTAICFLLVWAITVRGQSTEAVSSEALNAASAKIRSLVDNKKIEGAAHLVFHRGKVVYFDVAGVCDLESRRPFKRDTILRLYSMTKPITSVAAMTLYEQGKFALDDPLSKFVPGFASAQVLVKQGDSFKPVPPSRPVTVRDVFRHSTGYTYGRGTPPAFFEYYDREGLMYDKALGMFPPKMPIRKAADALTRIPAAHHPGAKFTYGFSTDLLGALIEIWSGQPLDEYFQHAILDPLEMHDTAFRVPADKKNRFASCHKWVDGKHVVVDPAAESPFNDGFEFLSGGGGLTSTINDYAKFCSLLINGGRFKDMQILKPNTLHFMFTNQLAEAEGDFEFGLGFATKPVEIGTGEEKRNRDAYYWGGYASTRFHVVPDERLFQIFLRQTIPPDHGYADEVFDIIYSGVK